MGNKKFDYYGKEDKKMEQLTLNDVYDFLGLPSIYDQYAETGEMPRWAVRDSEKLDLTFGAPEFCDGKMIIRIPFIVEELL